MTEFTQHFFAAEDGVRTYYRRYEPASPSGAAPVVCLHGLTRNSRDFEDIAPRIAATGRRVIAVDVRGRGRSDRAPDASTYYPGVYVNDVLGLLDAEGVDRVVSVGTSMGGLMTMILAAERPGFLKGVVLNDIGPELAPEGMARIQSYVGGASSFSSWAEAAAAVRAINGVAFPNETDEAFWIAFAKRVCRETDTGEIVLDYDPAIAQPVQEGDAAPPDLWPLFDAMADVPLLLVRGAITDLLSEDTVAEMKRRRPDMERVDVPDVGHAPLLTEPEAWSAIEAFLERVD